MQMVWERDIGGIDAADVVPDDPCGRQERRLILAMVRMSVVEGSGRVLQDARRSNNGPFEVVANAQWWWLDDESIDWGSASHACACLGLDRDAVRSALLRQWRLMGVLCPPAQREAAARYPRERSNRADRAIDRLVWALASVAWNLGYRPDPSPLAVTGYCRRCQVPIPRTLERYGRQVRSPLVCGDCFRERQRAWGRRDYWRQRAAERRGDSV